MTLQPQLQLQLDPRSFGHELAHAPDQRKHVGGARSSIRDDEVRVLRGDTHAPDAQSLGPGALDDNGKLAFRHDATDVYTSEELDESLRDDLEEAADVCPLQAITLDD